MLQVFFPVGYRNFCHYFIQSTNIYTKKMHFQPRPPSKYFLLHFEAIISPNLKTLPIFMKIVQLPKCTDFIPPPFFYKNYLLLQREGFKKKLVVNSTKQGGRGSAPDFPLRKKKQKNMGLKHWILPQDHFKTHLFFSIFGWGDPSQLGSWSEGCVKALKLSRESI